MQVSDILIIVWGHFLVDFFFQSDSMATNKSKSMFWLSIHSICYTIMWVWFGLGFAIINGLAHWLVDFFSSRATSALWKKEQRHWFFVVIGFDQAIHLTILVLTYQIIR